jgi:hydroxymethylbilane synthase
MMAHRTLIVGTRGSALALVQAEQVRERLPVPSDVLVIRTAGDRFQEVALSEGGGTGFFTREIEEALREGRIDLAVHSLKDLPVQTPPGLRIAAILAREATSDVLLVRPDALDESRSLPVREGARVGTSALRRRALLADFRPDLVAVPLRGNVPGRVQKVVRGECDAAVLARAGLSRLGHDPAPLRAFDLNPEVWPCSPGQAAVAVEIRDGDTEVESLLFALHHEQTARCVQAERQLLLASGGGCQSAFAAWAVEEPVSASVRVAMVAADGVFRRASFFADTLTSATSAALAWVLANAPTTTEAQGEASWTCRPAQPWY